MVEQLKNQAVNPRPRKAVKDSLNDRRRLFLKQSGSAILIAEGLTTVAAVSLKHVIENRTRELGGKLNGKIYIVR